MILLQAAGILAILSGVGHGFLGDKTLRGISIEPRELKTFIRLCYQFGSVGWIVGGGVFLVAPTVLTVEKISVLVALISPIYIFGAVVNVWFTKGRHFGWVLLTAVVALAFCSISVSGP